MSEHPLISVVSPVYRAEAIVPALVEKIRSALTPLTENFEVVLVEDGSPDASWEKICEEADKEDRVKAIRLSRNFGQHAAIAAGLSEAEGEFIAVIDCDLQENPAYIPKMFEETAHGFEIVYSKRKSRSHEKSRDLAARIFHRVLAYLTDDEDSGKDASTLTLLSRSVVDSYLSLPDIDAHFLHRLKWLGFRSTSIEIEHQDRHSGESSYTWTKLFVHALDGIISRSNKLLYFSAFLGFLFCTMAACSTIFLIFLYFLRGFREGWASIAVLIIGSTGLILASLGVIGLYLGKTYEQAKNRPKFIVAERHNRNKN